MWNFVVTVVLPVLGTLLIGALGWMLTHFIANPILKVSHLRERIHEALFFTANVSNRKIEPDRYDEAVGELRRLAARLSALEHSLTGPVSWFLKRRGFDLSTATGGITGLSNSLDDKSGIKAALRYDIEKSLKLPLSYQTRPTVRD